MRTNKLVYGTCTLAILLLCASVTWAQTELKNDAFESGGTVSFQSGFVVGDMGASRFIPDEPCTITKVQLLFGGGATSQTATLHIYDDSGGVATPGSALITPMDVTLQGSNSAMNEIDVSALGVVRVTGPFRVAFEWQHEGMPSIARDADDTAPTYPDRNFIYSGGAWATSDTYGVPGDWVIRAFVQYQQDAGVQEDAAAVQTDAPAQSDADKPKDGGGCRAAGGAAGAAPLALLAVMTLGALGRRRRSAHR